MFIICSILFLMFPLLSLPVSFLGLLRDCNKKYYYVYCLLIAGSLAFLAYHISPEKGWDIYQYYMRMYQMQSLSSIDAIKDAIQGFQAEPLSYYLMYFISKTGKFGLYPAISAFFTYAVNLIIVCNVGRIKGYSKKEIMFMLFVLFTWLSADAIFSGIRYNMAYTFFALAIYLEFFIGKRKSSYLLYICAFLTHASITVFIVLRLALPLVRKFKWLRTFVCIFMATWSVFFNQIFGLISRFNFLNMGYISEKLSLYTEAQSGGRIGVYIVRYSRLIVCIAIALFLISLLKNKYDDKNGSSPKLITAQVGFMTFGAFNRLIYISRFFQVFAVLTPYYLIDFIRSTQGKNRFIIQYIIVFFSIIFFYNQLSVFSLKYDRDLFSLIFTPFEYLYY